ncbi:unnamed protein product [Periconia digitata]|uniref:Uncharacterized protein n=1 Tax=Periconia digitata TaxID=1303443 RepID=A0A9W4UKH6_9PLEO|nr:unnamed protein product [Periconia digitata]
MILIRPHHTPLPSELPPTIPSPFPPLTLSTPHPTTTPEQKDPPKNEKKRKAVNLTSL